MGYIFEKLWTTGEPAEKHFHEMCAELRVTPEMLEAVKNDLRRNTDDAAARGVFGVPSFVADGEVFWGADAIDFLKAFLKDPAVLRNDEMRRVDALPVAAARKV